MGYWGWRPLIFSLFISVWVIGCSARKDFTPSTTPTQQPRVTLTVRSTAATKPSNTPLTPEAPTFQPSASLEASSTPIIYVVQDGDSLLDIALRFGVEVQSIQAANGGLDALALQVGQQLIIPNPQNDAGGVPLVPTATPLPLPVSTPTCYDTPTENVLCLGEVENDQSGAVERVTVLIRLVRADGSALAESRVSIEQAVILPGDSAPYRVLFGNYGGQYVRVMARLQSAVTAEGDEERFVPLVIEEESGAMVNGRYVVTATVHNPSTVDARNPRAVVTLYGEEREVIGYRVYALDAPLAAGARLPIRIEVLSQVADVVPTHKLYVEARR